MLFTIVVVLIVFLVIAVVVFNGMQQHKEKLEAEKRAKLAKQKAIIDESEELLMAVSILPPSININKILQKRSLIAVKNMVEIAPESRDYKKRMTEFETRFNATNEQAQSPVADDTFILPDNDQQLVQILQCIKKLRIVLKSEQAKGQLNSNEFMQEDIRLEGYQLKINVESLIKRGNAAQSKDMVGSARQYFEKALKVVSDHPRRSDYLIQKKAELESILEEITNALKSSNAEDRAKKEKDEQDDLDVLFQPKKKW